MKWKIHGVIQKKIIYKETSRYLIFFFFFEQTFQFAALYCGRGEMSSFTYCQESTIFYFFFKLRDNFSFGNVYNLACTCQAFLFNLSKSWWIHDMYGRYTHSYYSIYDKTIFSLVLVFCFYRISKPIQPNIIMAIITKLCVVDWNEKSRSCSTCTCTFINYLCTKSQSYYVRIIIPQFNFFRKKREKKKRHENRACLNGCVFTLQSFYLLFFRSNS